MFKERIRIPGSSVWLQSTVIGCVVCDRLGLIGLVPLKSNNVSQSMAGVREPGTVNTKPTTAECGNRVDDEERAQTSHISACNQVEHVGKSLLQEADRVFKEHGKLTEEILSALHFVYQGPLLSALELVDKGAVSRLVSSSGRAVYQVIGSSGTPYTCFTTSHYCSCPAFTFSVLHKEDHMMCKHHLAVHLSNITGNTKQVNVSDQHLASILSALE